MDQPTTKKNWNPTKPTGTVRSIRLIILLVGCGLLSGCVSNATQGENLESAEDSSPEPQQLQYERPTGSGRLLLAPVGESAPVMYSGVNVDSLPKIT